MSAPHTFTGAAATLLFAAINEAHTSDNLDQLSRDLWKGYGQGLISEDDATSLATFITRRRPNGRVTAASLQKSIGKLAGRVGMRFTPRQRQRSPDRKASRDRRRTLGGSSTLPNNLRRHYTEGQRAVLCIVAGEVKRHGICDFPIDKIAALAGVCRTTVQTAMHEARRLAHIKITQRPVPGRKSLPNVVEVITPEWTAWLRRGPSFARLIGSNLPKMVSTTKNKDRRKETTEKEKSTRLLFRPPDIPRWDYRRSRSATE